MKIRIALVLSSFFLFGCAAGEVDARFNGEPSEIVIINGYPVDVTILKISDGIFDVEAKEGRFIAFTGINEPLMYYDRFRRGAMEMMRKRFGKNATIETLSEITPTGFVKVFIRYEVTL